MNSDCPFCNYSGPSPIIFAAHLKRESIYVIEPINPVAAGHALVIPVRHVEDALEDPELTGEVMRLAATYARSLRDSGLEACNIITSVGEQATQTIRHLHVHVVPRSEGDGLRPKWPWS